MGKVIFIMTHPLIRKYYEDFYFDEIINNGFHLQYWDLSSIYYSDLQIPDAIEDDYIFKINSIKEFERKVCEEKSDKTLFVSQMTYEWSVLKIFRVLSKYNCITTVLSRGALPIPERSVSNFLKKNNIKEIFDKIYKYTKSKVPYFLKKIGYIKPYTFIFTAGYKGIGGIGVGYDMDLKYSKIIQLNSFDYDKFLEINNKEYSPISNKYCVFLDEYLPYHPDWDILNYGKVDPVEYYRTMNVFFEKIEVRFGVRVIIATHPKADYKTNPYDNRELHKYDTARLVKDAEFTMAHMSSSINFAVLFKKKVLLLITEEYKNVYKNSSYLMSQSFANSLNETLINCNQDFPENIDISKIDYDKYQKYKYNFLTSFESESKKSSKIIIDFLKKFPEYIIT